MSFITVRFVHRQSHTPVLELEVEATATVGALRNLLMDRMASEEICMMRVFVKWHTEVEAGSCRKRLIELTDEDSMATLKAIGIDHLSEVYLDGPLTGNGVEGVGQALAVLAAQIHQMDNGQNRLASLLETLVAQNKMMGEGITVLSAKIDAQSNLQQSGRCLALLPSEECLARQSLWLEEMLAIDRMTVVKSALDEYSELLAEEDRCCPSILFQATLDRLMYHNIFTISEDGTTATKTNGGNYATFRSSQPLSTSKSKHKWRVRIDEDARSPQNVIIGLLPKYPYANLAQGEGSDAYIGSATVGGWGMIGNGFKYGDWQCPLQERTAPLQERGCYYLRPRYCCKDIGLQLRGPHCGGYYSFD